MYELVCFEEEAFSVRSLFRVGYGSTAMTARRGLGVVLPRRESHRRTWLAALTSCIVVIFALLSVSTQSLAASEVTPDSGPVSGGTEVSVPKPIAPGGYAKFSQAWTYGLAIGNDGLAYSWGRNNYGQLGNGLIDSSSNSSTPAPVLLPPGVKFIEISAGAYNAVALGGDGSVYAWGEAGLGATGNGNTTDSGTPSKVSMPPGVKATQIVAGNEAGAALTADGDIYTWGHNTHGMPGNGTNSPNNKTPVKVLAPPGVKFSAVDIGEYFMLAIGTNGKTYSWGINDYGQLGAGVNDYTGESSVPIEVKLPNGVAFVQVSAGDSVSYALDADGNLYGWGRNNSGQLAGATAADRSSVPIKISTPNNVAIAKVEAGYESGLALGVDGKLYSWGKNTDGQLGLGDTTGRSELTEIAFPPGVTAFTDISVASTTGGAAMALGNDGNLYSWGPNAYGTTGQGTMSGRSLVPAKVLPHSGGGGVVLVTSVTFDGIPGTTPGTFPLTTPILPRDNSNGTVSVETPPHPAGPVNVVVEWTLNGVPQTPITYVDGFTYLDDPVWTIAKSATVNNLTPGGGVVYPGDVIDYEVTATGGPRRIDNVVLTDDLNGVLGAGTFVSGSATLQIGSAAPISVADPSGGLLTSTAVSLPAKEKITLKYQVLVNADAWLKTLKNQVTGTGSTPPSNCVAGASPMPAECSTTHVTGALFELKKLSRDASGVTSPLTGASFEVLRDASGVPGSVVATLAEEPGKPGAYKLKGLLPGTYWLREVSSPSGYTMLAKPAQFVLNQSGVMAIVDPAKHSQMSVDHWTISVVNYSAIALPLTGGPGSTPYLGVGALLIIVVSGIALTARFRSRRSA